MKPNLHTRIVGPEDRLTPEALRMFQDMQRTIDELETRLSAAEVVLQDHEDRIVDLEP
jgi:hypothetical protein